MLVIFLVMVYCLLCILFCFFFFKQKTAYEMRISDWSSDVCSSDLHDLLLAVALDIDHLLDPCRAALLLVGPVLGLDGDRIGQFVVQAAIDQIGRASCRERVCQYV